MANEVNCMNVIQYGDLLTSECEKTMQSYDAWNAEVAELHEQNSHLYFREIKIREPPPSEKRSGVRSLCNIKPMIDPLLVAMDQLDNEYRREDQDLLNQENMMFERVRNISYYKRQKVEQKNDRSLRVNQFRMRDPDAPTPRVNAIPNSSRTCSEPTNMTKRRINMRAKAFETAQSARGDKPISVPPEIRRIAYKKPKKEKKFPNVKAIADHRETKKKIEQLEVQLKENMRVSARYIRRINQRQSENRVERERRMQELPFSSRI